MTTTIDKAKQLIQEYNEKLQELHSKVSDCDRAIELLQLEIRFLQQKEIPEMQTKVVLDGIESSQVTKLKNKLEKYQNQLQEKHEEKVILANAIQRYQYETSNTALEVRKLLTEDMKLVEEKCYSHMLHAKKHYIDTILAESEKLSEVSAIDSQLQLLLVAGGKQKNVYPALELTKSNQLPLSIQEVRRFITNQYSENDYNYLLKYSDKKAL